MDAVKARMVHEGYPLADSTPQGNETVWKSLAGGVRRAQLLALVGITPEAFEERLRDVRQQRRAATGRK